MMLPQVVQNAIQYFNNRNPKEVSREVVMAYSTLAAYEHYYFDRVTSEIKDLTQIYSWVKDQEPARVIKQKRIMSWIIARELEGA